MNAFKFNIDNKEVIVRQTAYAKKSYPWGDKFPHYRFRFSVESNGVVSGPFSYYASAVDFDKHKTKFLMEDAADALSCLCSDALIGAETYDDYSGEFGSDADPKTYYECAKTYAELQRVLTKDEMSTCSFEDICDGVEL